MALSVNAGGRFDRLPVGSFHYRIMWLIGLGMFLDGFDIYVAGTVLGATLKSGFSTLGQNALFVSVTFLGMMTGAFATGFLGDRFGRRFTYQANLLLFGAASIAAAFAPSMSVLIVLRFFIGIGLGAENVVGYATMTEFVPARSRGRWLGLMAVFVVTGLPAASLVGYLVIPTLSWRAMFIVGGIGALAIWVLRKRLPESPRWLESAGRVEEAERLMLEIEAEAGAGRTLPPPAPPQPIAATLGIGALLSPPLLSRMVVGCICLVVVNTLLYGFVTWLPTFFVTEGFSIARSAGFALLMGVGAPVGSAIGALMADRWGRKPTIVGASVCAIVFGAIYPTVTDPVLLPVIGFALTVPIYVLVALLFGIYIPELFPTSIRLRASGICHAFGRGATVVTPFIVVALFQSHGVGGVMALMIGLLVLQAVVVALFGVEPSQRGLEEIEQASPGVLVAAHPATIKAPSTTP